MKELPTIFLLVAVIAGLGAYQADLANAAPVAPCLDAVTGQLFTLVPALQSLPEWSWFVASGAEAGLVVFAVEMALYALLARQNLGSGPMDARIRKRAQRRRKEHWAGFNS